MFSRLLLIVGVICVALACVALVQGEVRDAAFGFGLGLFLLWCWRWALSQPR